MEKKISVVNTEEICILNKDIIVVLELFKNNFKKEAISLSKKENQIKNIYQKKVEPPALVKKIKNVQNINKKAGSHTIGIVNKQKKSYSRSAAWPPPSST